MTYILKYSICFCYNQLSHTRRLNQAHIYTFEKSNPLYFESGEATGIKNKTKQNTHFPKACWFSQANMLAYLH